MFATIVSGVLPAAVVTGGAASGDPLSEYSSPAPVVVVRGAEGGDVVSPLNARDQFCKWVTFLC